MLKFYDGIEYKLEGYSPFTPLGITSRILDRRTLTILDLGCGKGDPMLFINRKDKYFTTGVDIYPAYLEMCRRKKSHDIYINDNIMSITLPGKFYDVVLGLRILEHLNKQDGLLLLNKMEQWSKRQIIISTPIEDYKQSAYEGNDNQEHKSNWTIKELEILGYRTYINGIKGFQMDTNNIGFGEKIYSIVGHGLWAMFGWLPLFIPSLGANVVAVKNL